MPGTLNINQINMTSPNGSLTKSLTLANTGQPQLDGKGLGLLAEYTVTGSAVTSIDFSGLDINSHKSYRVEVALLNATTSACNLYLYFNDDSVNTNYWTQLNRASGTSVSAVRNNNPYFGYMADSVGYPSISFINITKSTVNNWTEYHITGTDYVTSLVQSVLYVGTYNPSSNNITKIKIVSSVANSIATGSTIRIYRGDI